MKNFYEFPKDKAQKLEYILHDIDDTITENGKLLPNAYQALWDLFHEGFKVIPITGRPAGWCDLIIRQWPVDAIIGENGAFCFYLQNGLLQKLIHPLVCENVKEQLKQIQDACLREAPGCRVAKDQFSRLYDLAIDFNEEEPRLGYETAYRIQSLSESFGAEAKVSSIHVNVWFGKYDKLSMTQILFEKIYQEKNIKEKSLFFGDSPNDEPMFDFFTNSCAVANIKPFLDKL
ncbi:MAG: HAD-IIB family hydrolase, partial [Synergistaceae bacterium]|nr:HAD-IIB family hydrolase [Synergistaceae bacterium]